MGSVAQLALGGALAFVGGVLLLAGVLGQIRFPDVYTRLHALSFADGAGVSLMTLGLAVAARDGGIALKLVLLGIAVFLVQPLLAHLAASGAHAGGVSPLVGALRKPRAGGHD